MKKFLAAAVLCLLGLTLAYAARGGGGRRGQQGAGGFPSGGAVFPDAAGGSETGRYQLVFAPSSGVPYLLDTQQGRVWKLGAAPDGSGEQWTEMPVQKTPREGSLAPHGLPHLKTQ